LELVLKLLETEQWKVKLAKCSLAKREIAYLGYVISEQGVSTNLDKITAVCEWPTPTNMKELRSFLGLVGYYRKFFQHFEIIAKPLTDLLKKNSLFIWTSEHDTSFQTLKSALVTAPVLALPDFSKPFVVEIDASDKGVGAVLMQSNHPVAFVSKCLGPKLRGLSTYEKEYIAILLAVEQWRSYLQLGEFIISTDQRSLSYLSEQRLHTSWQQNVFTKLLGLNYRIQYKKGTENVVADALSRRSHETSVPLADSACLAFSIPQSKWLLEVIESYMQDEFSKCIIAKLALDSDAVPHFSWNGGILRYKTRIWVGNDKNLHLKLIQALHSSAVGGHSGIPITYRRMKQLFAWTGMKSAMHQFVKECMACQQEKPDRSKSAGLLQPLTIPEGPDRLFLWIL
jgi:hypothetical protein